MRISIQAIHFSADKKLEEVIEKKLTKLQTFYDKIIGADVFLKVDKKEAFNNKVVEIKMNVAGHDLFASETKDSFEAATDEATEALRRQLKKIKEKQVAH